MNIKPIHPNFKLPVKSTELAGGYDLAMPEAGTVYKDEDTGKFFGLGFAAEVPVGYVALLVPRSGKGAKGGISLNNTIGIIDPDYRGEWMVCLRNRNTRPFSWEEGERVVQMILVEAKQVQFNVVDELSNTDRGEGGFGSTGK
jgi:dUTP pyrophosphatase